MTDSVSSATSTVIPVVMSRARDLVVGAVAGLILPYLLLSLLFYAFVQVQHYAFGQVIVLHQHIRTIGLAVTVAAVCVFLLRVHHVRVEHPRILALSLMYCAYLVLDFVFKAVLGRATIPALVYATTYLYFYVFFVLLLLLVTGRRDQSQSVVEERGAFRFVYFVAVPVFMVGFAQWLLNDPLLVVADESGYAVEVFINTKLQHVRAFSVFGSGFAYGHFITFVAALTIALILVGRQRKRLGPYALFALATLAIVTTYTRNAFLEFLLSVAGVLVIREVIKRGWSNGRIVAMACGVGVAAYAAIMAFFALSPALARGILDVETFGIRLIGVASVVNRFFVESNDIVGMVFGYGYIQGPKFADLQGIRMLIFDNTYVDVALFSGIVGLIWHVAFFVALFAFVLIMYRRTRAYWWLAMAGMYFSYPLISALNIYVAMLYLLTSLVIAYDFLARRQLIPVSQTAHR